MVPGTVCDRQESGFFSFGLMVDASGWLVTSDGLLFLERQGLRSLPQLDCRRFD